jgi:hypothetical protein
MRTYLNIGVVFSLLIFPWWITALITIVAFFIIDRFYEGMFYGILLDALYGTSFGIYGFAYVFTAAFLGVFFIVQIIKTKVMW